MVPLLGIHPLPAFLLFRAQAWRGRLSPLPARCPFLPSCSPSGSKANCACFRAPQIKTSLQSTTSPHPLLPQLPFPSYTSNRSSPSLTAPSLATPPLPTSPPRSAPLLSVAPMMDWTDVHFRQLARIISRHTWLYTEMVGDSTLIHQHEQLERFLAYPSSQLPLVLQLGGNMPHNLAAAVALAAPYKYTEINLNCGCPSERVAGEGSFGASLMLEPERVASIARAMADASPAPISIKCRIGVDDLDSYYHLYNFVQVVSSSAPVPHFIIHSRKAFLKGLSPAENRTVPPLKYEFVLALIRDFPHLLFTINGGILNLHQAAAALSYGVHGVMIGRAAYNTPWQVLSSADRYIFGAEEDAVSCRREVLEQYMVYADRSVGVFGGGRPSIQALVKPLLGLFHGERRGACWRRAIDGCIRKASTPSEVIRTAMLEVPPEVLDAPPSRLPFHLEHLALGPLPLPPRGWEGEQCSSDVEEDVEDQNSLPAGEARPRRLLVTS